MAAVSAGSLSGCSTAPQRRLRSFVKDPVDMRVEVCRCATVVLCIDPGVGLSFCDKVEIQLLGHRAGRLGCTESARSRIHSTAKVLSVGGPTLATDSHLPQSESSADPYRSSK
jgi:hypothetical protein